jgi:PTH1 family peptidyl-tRNA hydrolase
MPKTFVNRSGEALALVKKAFSLDLPRCMVIADDLNLPIGSLRLRRSGSDGGHNGLKSIIQSVGEGFPRLRIGIGPVSEKEAVMDFVLGDFTKEQKESIGKTVCEAAEACRYFADNTIEKAMNKYNK